MQTPNIVLIGTVIQCETLWFCDKSIIKSNHIRSAIVNRFSKKIVRILIYAYGSKNIFIKIFRHFGNLKIYIGKWDFEFEYHIFCKMSRVTCIGFHQVQNFWFICKFPFCPLIVFVILLFISEIKSPHLCFKIKVHLKGDLKYVWCNPVESLYYEFTFHHPNVTI